jgi:hypothetical protein
LRLLAGGTNCRFQVWQLDKHLRPSRMVLEQVGIALCCCCCRAGHLTTGAWSLDTRHVPPSLPGALLQFYPTADYKHFTDALSALLQLEALQ